VETIHGNFMGVANIGYSPTFDDHIFTIEVHILDFDYNIYGTRIRVNMVTRLRDEKKFANLEQLSGQIRKDIETAKEILSKNGFVRDHHIS
jgi:riboflavin kinase/FMN adenylyltransferase